MTVQIVLPLLLVVMQISLAELSCSSCRAFNQLVQAQVEKEIALEVAKQNILSKLHLQQRPNISHTVPRESLALALLRLNITLDEDHSVQMPTQNGEDEENLGIDQNHEIISFAEIDQDGPLNERPSAANEDEDGDNSNILPTPSQDPEQIHSYQRVLGEMALQLERRILFSIFLDQPSLYGFVVSNIEEKIYQVTTCPLTKYVDEAKRSVLYHRYHETFKKLKNLGYDKNVHPFLSEYLVNTYGVLNVQPPTGTSDIAPYLQHPEELRKIIARITPTDLLKEVYILLDCLIYLAEDDRQPLLLW